MMSHKAVSSFFSKSLNWLDLHKEERKGWGNREDEAEKRAMTCLEVQADGGENQALEILNQVVKGAKTLRILAFLNFKKRANLGGLQKEEKRIVKEEKEKKKKAENYSKGNVLVAQDNF